jgi:UDP-N-acetylmuramate dehydrogenase
MQLEVGADALFTELSQLAPVRRDVLGSDLTTFAIGGELSLLVEPQDLSQLLAVSKFLAAADLPWRVLGAGSNLLISDQGVKAVVLKLGKGFRTLSSIEHGRVPGLIEVGGAASLMTLSRSMSEQGLSGLEFAGGIPASIGGAVFMNAGAHGGEIGAVLKEVAFVIDGEEHRVAAKTLPFSYRHSGIDPKAIVTSAIFELTPGDREKIIAHRAECLRERKLRQPLNSPSAGSVFRNPAPDAPAGRLIESCGLKGQELGGAQISEMHGNWIVNPRRVATSKDVQELISLCIQTVNQMHGVTLRPEVVSW